MIWPQASHKAVFLKTKHCLSMQNELPLPPSFFQTAMIHWSVWAFLKRSAVCLFVLLKDTQSCVSIEPFSITQFSVAALLLPQQADWRTVPLELPLASSTTVGSKSLWRLPALCVQNRPIHSTSKMAARPFERAQLGLMSKLCSWFSVGCFDHAGVINWHLLSLCMLRIIWCAIRLCIYIAYFSISTTLYSWRLIQ